jgi:hypothetical protein
MIFGCLQELEPGDLAAVDLDEFLEHGARADPEPPLTVVRAIHDHFLFGFAMSGNSQHEVVLTLVMTIQAGLETHMQGS